MNTAANKIVNTAKLRKNSIGFIGLLFFAITVGIIIVHGKWLYAMVVLSPLLVYLCIKKPFIFPFGAYVFLLPFDRVLSVTGHAQGATLTKFLGVLTILVLLLKGTIERKLKQPDNAALWWMLFVMYGLFSLLWAIQPELSLSKFPTVTGLLVLFLVAASYDIKKSEFETLKWLIIVGGFLATILSIYNYASLETIGRISIRFGERSAELNHFAFSLLIPFSVCLEMMLKQNMKTMRVLFGIILGVILFGIFITGSRGNALAAAVIIIVYIISIKQKITFGTIAIVIGLTLMAFVPDFFTERWGGALETGGAGRLSIWNIGLTALKKYWLYGAGFNNFPNAYDEFFHSASFLYTKSSRAPHNTFLGIFVELGIIGFSLMVLAMIKNYQAIRSRFNHYCIDKVTLRASFCGILVSSFFLDTFSLKSFWLLWMMIMMYENVVKMEVYKQVNSARKVSKKYPI